MRALVSYGLLILAVGYVIAAHGGIEQADWSVSLALLGLGALICPFSRSRTTASLSLAARVSLAASFLLLAFVAFQLVPLPTLILRLLSPTRAEIAAALATVAPASMLSPLSLLPAATWTLLFQAVASVLVFVLVRHLAGHAHSTGMTWAPAASLVAIGGIEAALGLLWKAGDADPISGTYFNKNHFSGLLELTLPLATMYAIVLFRQPDRWTLSLPRAIAGSGLLALAVLMFVAISYSLSKAGFVSTLASLLAIALLAPGSTTSRGRRWLIIVGLLAVGAVVFVFVPPDALVRQFGNMATDDTGEGRVPVARDTIRLIAAFPLFGSGLGTYYPAFLRYQTSALDYAVTNAHNDYLQALAELGLVGAAILAALLGGSVINAWRAASSRPTRDVRFLGLGCLGSFTALLVHSAADFNLYVPANAMAFAWVAGIAAGLPRAAAMQQQTVSQPSPSTPVAPSRSVVRRLVPVLGCLAIAYAGLSLTFLHLYQFDAQAERVFCRLGVCDSFSALAVIQKEHGDDPSAVPPSDFLTFLARDPANPTRWADLGDALQHAGNQAEARRCFERALALGPRIPQVLIRAARFHFRLEENHAAFPLMVRALDGNPSFDRVVQSEYERLGLSMSDIVAHGLPDNPAIWREYLRRELQAEPEVAHERGMDAGVLWNALVERRYADNKLAGEYIEFLLRHSSAEAAADTWSRYVGQNVELDRVFNGGFESDPTGVRFDWGLKPWPGVVVDVDRSSSYEGSSSLRVRFDGKANVGEVGVQQQIYLPPGGYRLRAYVRTSDITTDQGIFIRVSTLDSPKRVDAATPSLRGSNEWTLLETTFKVPTDGGLVLVSLERKPSLKFDNLVRGTVWVDEVSLSRVE
ncbi:MAG: hypothetical protein DMF89_27030 [Acidobacteria bacterium]|nr:MAG: hypothetical protein DMF90_01360 [Acidobacteriota bacterium]PYR44750.1 MAG: hypothetical protein DMF89_27030 [Acidobacteriota bacterium]